MYVHTYDMGEVFVMLSGDDVQQQLESRKSKIEKELVTVREEVHVYCT